MRLQYRLVQVPHHLSYPLHKISRLMRGESTRIQPLHGMHNVSERSGLFVSLPLTNLRFRMLGLTIVGSVVQVEGLDRPMQGLHNSSTVSFALGPACVGLGLRIY